MSRTPGPAGLVVLDKPGGVTSHDMVSRVRRCAQTRRVGHAGTLDPMATGVLLLGVNRATRLLGHLSLTHKSYRATVRLGVATDTDDADGEVTATTPAGALTEAAVTDAVAGLVGEIQQVPSRFSAVKVDGRRAYARARAGEQVNLAARTVRVHALTLTRTRRTGDVLDVDLDVRCGSGTYVRALARDLGAALGVGGHLTALRRTSVGPFDVAEAVTPQQLDESFTMLDLAAVASRCFAVCSVDTAQARAVEHGQKLAVTLEETQSCAGVSAGPVALFGPDGQFLALYRQRGCAAVPVAVFAAG